MLTAINNATVESKIFLILKNLISYLLFLLFSSTVLYVRAGASTRHYKISRKVTTFFRVMQIIFDIFLINFFYLYRLYNSELHSPNAMPLTQTSHISDYQYIIPITYTKIAKC